MTPGRRRGRVEAALDRTLAGRADIDPAERAALRAQAAAIDYADEDRDARAITAASEVYLRLRRAAGLVAPAVVDADDVGARLERMLRGDGAAGDQVTER